MFNQMSTNEASETKISTTNMSAIEMYTTELSTTKISTTEVSAAEIEHPSTIFPTFEKNFWYLEEFFSCLENPINNNLKSFC